LFWERAQLEWPNSPSRRTEGNLRESPFCGCETNKQTQTRAQKNKANKPHEIRGIHLMHSLGQPHRNAVGEQRPSQQRPQSPPHPRKSNPTPLPMASLLWMHDESMMMCSEAREKI